MSSFSSPSPVAIPFRLRRKSASTSISMDEYIHDPSDAVPCSSTLLSSFPLCLPVHFARRNERTKWQAGDSSDDNRQDRVDASTRAWSCRTFPLPYTYQPLPPLTSKFAAHALPSDAPLSYGTPPSDYVSKTTYFFPQGDSAIADDCEEYDLESMDIHIRETYFATSAERGRWLSSPIAPRVQSQAVPPMRGHSSPVKPPAGLFPRRGPLHRHKISCSDDGQIAAFLSKDGCEEACRSSPLPPSSPLTSPMSDLPCLGDCEDDSIVDPHSNSDTCRSHIGTPELSVSSTTCSSPVEPTRIPTPHEAPSIVPVSHTIFPCHPGHSIISRHTSPSPLKPLAIHIHTPSTPHFEPDDILSPLSQFDFDLPEAELAKLPLSDTVNKPRHGQHSVSLETGQSQDALPSIQSLSMNCHRGIHEASLDIVKDSSSNKKGKKRRGSAAGKSRARQTRKRVDIRLGSPLSDAKERRGKEGGSSSHSEPPRKRRRLSHCREGSKKASLHGETFKVKRLSRSPSRAPADGCGLECADSHNKKTLKPTGQGQLRQPSSSASATPVINDVDADFHASLTGMLIEALATSRATSMDASALYLVLSRTHPLLLAERSKGELLMDIAAALEAGRTRCGMFEKVDGSGERTRHQALECRWFYLPERDEDRERASLISAVMPRQKRTETKKYKQYYYRPLDKMSRWDPEDAP